MFYCSILNTFCVKLFNIQKAKNDKVYTITTLVLCQLRANAKMENKYEFLNLHSVSKNKTCPSLTFLKILLLYFSKYNPFAIKCFLEVYWKIYTLFSFITSKEKRPIKNRVKIIKYNSNFLYMYLSLYKNTQSNKKIF